MDYPVQEEFARHKKETDDPNEPLHWRALPVREGVDRLGFLERKGLYEKWARRNNGRWEVVFYSPRPDGESWMDQYWSAVPGEAVPAYDVCRCLETGSAERPGREKRVRVDGRAIGLSMVFHEPYERAGIDSEGKPVTERGTRQREHWTVEAGGEWGDYFRVRELPLDPAKPGAWLDYRRRPVQGAIRKALEIARERLLARYRNWRERTFPGFEVTSDVLPRFA